jgi:hypothetical protein
VKRFPPEIKNYLSVTKKKQNYKFYFNPSVIDSDSSLDEMVESILRRSVDYVLKEKGSRFVAVMGLGGKKKSVIYKSYTFKSLSKQLYRYSEVGRSEVSGMVGALSANIPCPDIYAYGERFDYGLCKQNILVMENITNCFHPDDYFKQEGNKDMIKTRNILERCKKLFLKLYHAKCNHIDTKADAIYLANHDQKKDVIIDFQYATYMEKESMMVLVYQLSRFVKSIMPYCEKEILDQWVKGVVLEAGADGYQGWEKHYREFLEMDRPGAKERVQLWKREF